MCRPDGLRCPYPAPACDALLRLLADAQASIVRVCVEVASAVEFLHAQSPPIVHVDLAARNVVVNDASARLVDFGLARAMCCDSDSALDASAPEQDEGDDRKDAAGSDGAEDDASAFAAALCVGASSDVAQSGAAANGNALDDDDDAAREHDEFLPLRILAPEVLVSARNAVSRASDVYAFGMLVYEVLLGTKPWGYRAAVTTLARLAVRGVRPPLPPPALVDEGLTGLIADCLHASPALRPTMKEVRLRLQAWLDAHADDRAAHARGSLAADESMTAFLDESAHALVYSETVYEDHRRGVSAEGDTPEYARRSDCGDDFEGSVCEYARPPKDA